MRHFFLDMDYVKRAFIKGWTFLLALRNQQLTLWPDEIIRYGQIFLLENRPHDQAL
jgi:hypothetical protein